MPDNSDITPREDRIRRRAHELWEEAGRPDGQDDRFWREAEADIEGTPVPGRIDPPIQRDDPAGPPVGKPLGRR